MSARSRCWSVMVAKGHEYSIGETSGSHDIIRGETADYEPSVIMGDLLVIHDEVTS